MSFLYWYKKYKVWYFCYSKNGKVIKKSLKTADKKLATHMKLSLDIELGKINAGLSEALINYGKACDLFLSERRSMISPAMTRRYEIIFFNWSKYLTSLDIAHVQRISGEVVKGFVSHRRESGTSPKTVKEELRCMKTLFSWLIERGDLAKSPVLSWPKLKTPCMKPETIGGYSREEIEKILEWFRGSPAESAVWFLAFAGARVSEGRALRVHDINFPAKTMRLLCGKTLSNIDTQFRHVEIHPRLAPILKSAITGKSSDSPVFPALCNHKEAWVTQLLETCCRQLGIQYRRAHGLRHSWITRLLVSGVPIAVVMKMAGHRNLSTTQKYLHLGEQHQGWIGNL